MSALAPRLQSWRLSLPPAGMLASLLLHGAIVALIVLAQFAPAVDVLAITSVEVELVSMAQFAALAAPPAAAPALSVPVSGEGAVAPSNETAAEPAAAPSTGPFRATTFYAGGRGSGGVISSGAGPPLLPLSPWRSQVSLFPLKGCLANGTIVMAKADP